MRRKTVSAAVFSLILIAGIPLVTSAQATNTISTVKPGRDPNQPIDEEYTRKILEYTTEKFFLSPLVDYLPASKSVPTPKAILGDIAGAKNNLPYSKDVYAYMRLLAKSSPRVKVVSIGTTEEGREMIAVAVADEKLINRLDENRARLAKLADPRTINLDDKQAEKLVNESTPVYYITGTIHSPESGAPTALMELAYRLAVDDSPYIKQIRNNVITLITPIVEVDGRDREVDVVRWHMAHPNDAPVPLLYWGHYVGHDNNRDAMGMTLKLSQNVMNTYIDWKAQVLHDLHESGEYLYDNTIGDGPYNSWLDPLLANEWQMIGWNNVQEMTRLGMPGVYAHGTFDTWSPGYLMFMAATHNGISRLYETFGNGGTAETVERTLSASQTSRTWWRQNPPLPRVMWSLRNNNNYEQTGLLVSLFYFANNRHQLLQNFYEKSKRSITKPRVEGPAAYVLSSADPRLGAQADLLKVLQLQHVEISRATSSFSVSIPRRVPAGGRGARGGRAGGAADGEAPAAMETHEFPAGSYVIRMDQPYARIADALLDHQFWSPNDPQKTPYDDTGWSFPENFAVQTVRVTDVKVLDVPMERVTTVGAPGGVTGAGAVAMINHNGDNALATLRYRFKDADMQAAEEPFESNGQKFNRGSFIIRGVAAADLDKATKELGLKVYAGTAPSVKTHPIRAARVALMHTWISTQTEGWWRMGFDNVGVPYDYISTQDLAKIPDLKAKYDVIVFGPAGGSPEQIVEGMPMWRNPMPWKVTPETPNITPFAQTDDIRPGMGLNGLANLRSFVERGGVLITCDNTADFAVQFGFARGVSQNAPPRLHVVGSLLRTKIVDETSPIVYGIIDNLSVFSKTGESFNVSNTLGGRGGRGGGGGGARATGRGLPDDPDFVTGFPALDPKNQAAVLPSVQPWQAAPVQEEQLRNPLNIIPPEQRPRVPLRFSEQGDLLQSGLLDGTDIAQRPVVVDAPYEKGHVVLFGNNPIYRGMTIGSYFLVFNTILNFDNLNAGRKLDAR